MDNTHFKCLLWKSLWGLGVLSLLVAWLSLITDTVLGFDAFVWFWNAVIFAALSIPIKLDCQSCSTCGTGRRK